LVDLMSYENSWLKISPHAPSDVGQWDALAEKNGNLVQSTHFDSVQTFFRQQPVYFELWKNDSLVAGVKLFLWSSRKIGKVTETLSRTITQFGEMIFDPSHATNVELIAATLSESVRHYVLSEGIVSCQIGGYYGDERLLLNLESPGLRRQAKFNVAIVDLAQSEDGLWAGMHSKHRNAINKASKSDLAFAQENSFEEFMALLTKSYQTTPKQQPNTEYLKHLQSVLGGNGYAMIFLVRQGRLPLAAALISRFGDTAYYAFSGTESNGLGAGTLLQWEIMKFLKRRGVKKYVLGQVAPEVDHDNEKFSVGISRFKRRFGAQEVPSSTSHYVFKDRHDTVWRTLKKIVQLGK
jgi:Acetyltransferase (GNAT) domain